MKQKLLLSVSIMAVGLIIISGGVLAKGQLFEQVLIEEKSPLVALIGEAVGFTSGKSQTSSLEGEAAAAAQPVVYLDQEAGSANQPTQFEGTVAAVDLNDGLFDLSFDGSGVSAFHVNSETAFQGVSDFRGLSANMQVSISAFQKADGSWQVVSIQKHGQAEGNPDNGDHGDNGDPPPPNGDPIPEHPNANKVDVGGRVTSVGADTLTIQTQGGTPMTFAIGPETMINSHIGSHDSLDDIKVNFTVAVIYFDGDMLNGHRLAYRVVVANEGIAFNANQQGWVDSVGADQFTITTNFGASYTFMVDATTQVKGVGSFAELAAGMRAFVYYQDNGGTLLAKGIQVWPAP
jgi:hypothetical protein